MTEPDWKKIALYLADCHAATAEYDGLLASCSQARRDRFRAICERASRMIEGVDSFGHDIDERRVLDRLSGSANRLKVGK